MFSSAIVQVANLGKDYRIYRRPWHRLLEAVSRQPVHDLFTALDGVSFHVPRGTSLGIVGDNGAGKSTLLKLLVGITHPSRGAVRVNGRVTGLLELGAGFHPEFSGRQNILLNAALLGLTSDQIDRLSPKIIAFSEIEDFIDRPIKTYSSGMVVRLAFSIAVTVDPDILVIDEALAVGDLAFQRKCIDRMLQFREQGKTLIFCSHSMYHVQELCEQALWLDKGKVRLFANTAEVIAAYEAYSRSRRQVISDLDAHDYSCPDAATSPGADCAIESLWIEDFTGKRLSSLHPLADISLCMGVRALRDNVSPQFGFAFVDQDESIVAAAATHHDNLIYGPFRAGELIQVRLRIRALPLRQGTYRITGAVGDTAGLLWYESKHLLGVPVLSPYKGVGRVALDHQWVVG